GEFHPKEKNYLLGLITYQETDYDSARKYFEKCLLLDSTNKYIQYQLSYSYRSLGDYKKALGLIKKSENNSPGDLPFLIKAYLAEGALYYLSGEYDLADAIYKKSYTLSQENKLKETEGLSLVALGIMNDVQGFIVKARDYYKQALDIAESIQNIELKAYALSELGVSYSYTNELIESKDNYLKSYSLFRQMGNRLRLSLLSDNIGKIYMSIFNYESAIKYYQEGIEFAGDDKRSLILNFTGLADAYSNLANYAEALKYYNQAKKLSSEIKDIESGIYIYSGLGALNYNLDRLKNALGYYMQAEAECGKLNNPYLTADIYDKLGVVYSSIDSLGISEKYFLEAQKLAAASHAYYTEVLSGINLSEVLIKKQDYSSALTILNKSLKNSISEELPYLQARAEILIGNISEKKNDFEGARSSYNQALSIVRNLNEKSLEVEAYYSLAKLFESKNLNEAAESYYSSAVELIEDVSRPLFSQEDVQISYFSGNREVYDSFAEYYLKQQKYQKAFELIDKSHSRNMIQNLNNLKLQSLVKDSTVLSELYDYDWMIHSGIYDKARTEDIKDKLNKLKLTLVGKNPALASYLNMGKWPSLTDIQNSLSNDEIIISYYSTKSDLYAFLISNKVFKPFKLGVSKDKLSKLINSISPYFENNIAKSDAFYNQDLFSFNAAASYKLYEKIVYPLIQSIPKDQNIIFSPCTELLSLPFEFLVTNYRDTESPYTYRNKKYLLNDYDISYSPSATAFLQQQKSNLRNDGKVLLVGNPSINTESSEFAERRGLLEESSGIPRNLALLPLKYSGEEVNNIGEIITANTILLDKNATETNFKQNASLSRIIHLSTHSFLYHKQPLIFFSNTYDAENDGFLEAGEIVQLKLNSDLVVLSSCNSGLGSVDESEGILGLTKAFFEAGSKSVVVSLWDVNDKYTSKLMTLFYEKLSMGYDKSKALRLAKIEFIQKYSPDPYYWAAFVLSGNISAVNLKQNKNLSLSIVILILIIAAAVVVVLILNRKRFRLKNLSA
ncbi:MAG TPA: CHAT domain-containing protein, partial [Ignavibacteriaceae bacterium]